MNNKPMASIEPAFTTKDGGEIRAVLHKDGSPDDGYAYGNPASSRIYTDIETEGNLGVVRLGLTKTTWGSLFLTNYQEMYLSVSEAKNLVRHLQNAIYDATPTGKATAV